MGTSQAILKANHMVVIFDYYPNDNIKLFINMENWIEHVRVYKEHYNSDDYIIEYVDTLVPVYYNDILREFDDMTLVIGSEHAGLCIWEVMAMSIFNSYYESFMDHWQ